MVIEQKNLAAAKETGDTSQSVSLIIFAVALGSVLILAGLFFVLFRSQPNGPGVPLIVAGMFAQRLVMRLRRMNGIRGHCARCGTVVKSSDFRRELTCPDCEQDVAGREIHPCRRIE